MPPEQPSQSAQEPVDTHTGLLIVVVFFALLVVGLGALWYSMMRDKRSENVEQTQTDSTNTTDVTPDEVEGWQTYRNEEYGFEVQYPKDMETIQGVDQEGISRVTFTKEDTKFSVSSYPNIDLLNDEKYFARQSAWVSVCPKGGCDDTVLIDNHRAQKVFSDRPVDAGQQYPYAFIIRDQLTIIEFTNIEKATMAKIISGFKFTK